MADGSLKLSASSAVAQGMVACGFELAQRVAFQAAPIALRLGLGIPFFKSGLTRWDGWFHVAPATFALFEDEFKLNFPWASYDMPFPHLAAPVVATCELAFPIMLFLGFGTRIAALGLLGMTAVIELVYPDAWANFHLPWAAMALALLALGAGPLSLDYLLWGRKRAIF